MTISILQRNICLLLVLSALIVVSSCVDEIDFERPDAIENGIAIQGKLIKGDPSFVQVSVRRVFDFTNEPRLVNARRVVLLNEKGDELELSSTAIGIFTAAIPSGDPNFQVDYGDRFRIKVDLFDGRRYESDFDELYPVSPSRSLRATAFKQVRVNDITGAIDSFDVVGFYLNTSLRTPEQGNPRLLFEMEATYKLTDSPQVYSNRSCFPTRVAGAEAKTCYISISPNVNHLVVDANDIAQEELNDFELFTTPIFNIFAEGYYLSLFQQSLSPSAYEYWSQVNEVVNQEGGLFEAPSGKVISNMHRIDEDVDDVFGYFYVTEQNIQRVYVSPEQAGNVDTRCPAPLTEGGVAPTDCCDCSKVENSATQRPEWWVE